MGDEEIKNDSKKSELGLNPEELSKIENRFNRHEKSIEEINKLMFYVLIVLLVMVAGIIISTGLWVADSFINKNKSQIIYTKSLDTVSGIMQQEQASQSIK